MRKLGISVYPQHSELQEMKDYIQLAKKHGFTRIFTCLMSMKEEREISKLKEIMKFAKNLDFEISADIAPGIFEELGLTYRDIGHLKEQFSLAALRLDMGFSGQEEAFMSVDPSNLKIELNISNGTKYVENILSYEANVENIIGCHNFYPKKFTGLSREHFLNTSTVFKHNGIRTAAMISSTNGKLGPWEETPHGLPTLEDHRGLAITVQAKDLWHTGLIDDLIIGNMFASENELKSLGQLNRNSLQLAVQVGEETTELEKAILFDEFHFNRGDVSEYVIRSTQSRVKYKEKSFPSHNTQPLKRGHIIIDNDNDLRYKGELNIVLKKMPNTGLSNIIATVIEEEIFLLEQIKPWESFQFVKN